MRLSQLDPAKAAIFWRLFRFVVAALSVAAVVVAASFYGLWVASGRDPAVGAEFRDTGFRVGGLFVLVVVWWCPPIGLRVCLWLGMGRPRPRK